MKNRVPTYPGRVTLTPVAGAPNTYDMVRADVPVEEGTPLNKETMLQDSTATLLGLDSDATPDDALKAVINGKVPTSRTINNKALTSDISLSAADVSARPSTWTPITYGTSDLTAGSSSLDTGTVYLVYK
ncbi:hypothetical protein D1641_09655 [Colidextribacter sp. OB.20]|uniref:hypothetical protein n=1 Tax=Colidextribacter sp. OB.20 TaxID=2304568 RepID=UPI00136F3D74|nr:hypothetical protein [Colidextribacter sp. OB.20]NBI10273.1 hypothetical protein [Colidextribacter sp. OB.20]